PSRASGARPARTTSGVPLKCAVVTALTPLVTPGPAVITARPEVRVSRAVASAAKTAVCSCRTSMMGIGGGGRGAPAEEGDTGPPPQREHLRHPAPRA